MISYADLEAMVSVKRLLAEVSIWSAELPMLKSLPRVELQ